jgi:predicted dehydrogenase
MSSLYYNIKKVVRYIIIYGPIWTLFKIVGRTRKFPIGLLFLPKIMKVSVGVIGCGQFSYSTTAQFLYRKFGRVIVACLDVNSESLSSFSRSLRVRKSFQDFENFKKEKIDVVYIASNHFTHTEYAILSIEAGIKNIYIEKPISVNEAQLLSLANAYRRTNASIYAGFNRPFSKAILTLKQNIQDINQSYFVNMIVWGHKIDKNHWYRDPKEGSRISGNLGHWIDLMIHVLFWKENKPDYYDVGVVWQDVDKYIDENFVMSVKTSDGDIFTLQFGAMVDPFEGVSELIDFECENFCARIIDFTKIVIDTGQYRSVKSFWPKDAGHKSAVLQPFQQNNQRNFEEVLYSTSLTILLGNALKEKMPSFRVYDNDITRIYK